MKADNQRNNEILCIVCNDPVSSRELNNVTEEFKPFPAHEDCFDSFTDADEFLSYAKNECSHRANADKEYKH